MKKLVIGVMTLLTIFLLCTCVYAITTEGFIQPNHNWREVKSLDEGTRCWERNSVIAANGAVLQTQIWCKE